MPFHPQEEKATDTSLSHKRAASFRALANLTPLSALRNRFPLLLDELLAVISLRLELIETLLKAEHIDDSSLIIFFIKSHATGFSSTHSCIR